MSFKAFSSRKSSLTQTFVESCVDFEVGNLSVLMVRRLPYPEIPTLNKFLGEHWCMDCMYVCVTRLVCSSFGFKFQLESNSSGCPHLLHACAVKD